MNIIINIEQFTIIIANILYHFRVIILMLNSLAIKINALYTYIIIFKLIYFFAIIMANIHSNKSCIKFRIIILIFFYKNRYLIDVNPYMNSSVIFLCYNYSKCFEKTFPITFISFFCTFGL